GLTHLLLVDNFQSKWLKSVLNTLQAMGLSSQAILSMKWDEAKSALKQRILDMERQADLGSCPNFRVPDTHKYRPLPMAYLSQLETYKFRKAFTLARRELDLSSCISRRNISILLQIGIALTMHMRYPCGCCLHTKGGGHQEGCVLVHVCYGANNSIRSQIRLEERGGQCEAPALVLCRIQASRI
ncbi:hypothetical protein JRQ81_003103, partial [Phrynocephalus forsythii]